MGSMEKLSVARFQNPLTMGQSILVVSPYIVILNISRNGVTLTTVHKHGIEVGDEIKVKFALDNSASTEIEKKARVKWVEGNYMGCEFFETDKNDLTLAFYLL